MAGNKPVQTVQRFHYVWEVSKSVFHRRASHKDYSGQRFLGSWSSGQHILSVINKHSRVVEHIYLLFTLQ